VKKATSGSKAFVKVGIIPILVLLILCLAGCGSVKKSLFEERAKNFEKYLEEKYGEKFVVTGLQNRQRSLAANCSPVNREDLCFHASKHDDGSYGDNYLERLVSRQIEDIVIEKCMNYGIDVEAHTTAHLLQKPFDTSVTWQEYIEDCKPEYLNIYMVLSDSLESPDTAEPLRQAFQDCYDVLGIDKLNFIIRTITPEKFDECRHYVRRQNSFNKDIINSQYGIKKSFFIVVDAKGVEFSSWDG
jgi:hypothetical protein